MAIGFVACEKNEKTNVSYRNPFLADIDSQLDFFSNAVDNALAESNNADDFEAKFELLLSQKQSTDKRRKTHNATLRTEETISKEEDLLMQNELSLLLDQIGMIEEDTAFSINECIDYMEKEKNTFIKKLWINTSFSDCQKQILEAQATYEIGILKILLLNENAGNFNFLIDSETTTLKAKKKCNWLCKLKCAALTIGAGASFVGAGVSGNVGLGVLGSSLAVAAFDCWKQ